MSDELIHEITMDIEREKERLFLLKYKYPIIGLIIIFLSGALGYQYYTYHQNSILKESAADYSQLVKSYNLAVDTSNKANNAPPDASILNELSSQTLKNTPAYLAMGTLMAFNNAQKNDATIEELQKILDTYLDSNTTKPLTMHDSLLKLYALSLKTETKDFDTLQNEFVTYLNHPFSFDVVAYEMLFLLAIKAENVKQARHYLQNLQANADNNLMNKIKIYSAHPLLQQKEETTKDISQNKTSEKIVE